MNAIPTLKVILNLPIRPDQIPAFKTEILHLQDPKEDLWHNHFSIDAETEIMPNVKMIKHKNENGNIIRYPMIQFRFEKSGRSQLASIWAVGSGVKLLQKFVKTENGSHIRWEGKKYKLEILDSKPQHASVELTENPMQLIPYNLSHYLPFNEERYKDFKNAVFFQDKLYLIEHLIKQHLYLFFDAMQIPRLNTGLLNVKTMDLKAFKTVKYRPKQTQLALTYVSVDMNVGINAILPEEIGLGQLVSQGYGILRHLKNPYYYDG